MTAELPSSWTRESLGALSILGPQYGANAAAIDPVPARPRYVRITDIDDVGALHASETKSADLSDEREFLLQQGDLLLARSGNTVGKSYVHSDANGPCVFAGYLIRFRLDTSRIHPRFAFYFTKTQTYTAWIAARRRVGGQPNVNGGEYASLEIPHPIQLSEQARIVELLDQADALRRQRAAADAKLARLLPAIFRHHFGDPIEGSRGLKVETLGSLLSTIDSGESPRCLDRPARPDEWSVLKLGAVTWGRFDGSQNKALPDDLRPDSSLEVRTGDLLFSRKNTLELVGATALVRATQPRLLLPDLIFRLVPRENARITKEYLWCLLSQPSMRARLRSIASGAAGSMPNISKGRLEGVEIPLPPIEVQREFSRQVHVALDIETHAAASAAKLDSLFQTLLHRAFTGELTARWRKAHLREGVEEMTRFSRA